MKTKKIKPMIAYADVGSHGGIFMFESGKVADSYPTLLQIYKDKLSEELVPIQITPVKRKVKRRKK